MDISPAENQEEQTPPEEQKSNFTGWFREHWYILLYPSFICAAATQYTLSLPAAVTGFLSSLVIVWIAHNIENVWGRRLFIIITPLGLLIGLSFYSPFMHRHGQFPLLFGEADIHNPYLNNYKNFWRAVIAGIGAPLSVLVAFGAMKLFSSKNEIDGPKSVDDIRIEVELPDSNNKTDSTQ